MANGCWGSLYLDVATVNKRSLIAEINNATGIWGDVPLFIEDVDLMDEKIARYLARQMDFMTTTNIIATTTILAEAWSHWRTGAEVLPWA